MEVRWLVSFMDAGADDGCGIPAAAFGAATVPPLAFVVGNVFAIFWIAIFSPPF
jgi:hypothetical protein